MAFPTAIVTPATMDTRAEPPPSSAEAVTVPPIRLPALLTFAALVAGLAVGWLLTGSRAVEPVLAVAQPIGALWLNALQVTIIPLVAALIVSGISGMVATANAGPMARRTIALFYAVLGLGTLVAMLALPLVLDWLPIPAAAQAALSTGGLERQAVPGVGAFFESLIAPNIVAATAETAMLPLVLFFAAFAVAITRLPGEQRRVLLVFFAEILNSALEHLVDLATQEFDEKAKIAKDAAAAGVLVLAIGTVVIFSAIIFHNRDTIATFERAVLRQMLFGWPLIACASLLMMKRRKPAVLDALAFFVSVVLLGLLARTTTSSVFTSMTAGLILITGAAALERQRLYAAEDKNKAR